MLFKNSGFTSKFCLVGLDAEERKEIASLITRNGGAICTTRKPPVITFGNDKSVSRAGEPIFHVNFIRESVRHQRLLHLIDFIIGSPGYFGCLQCIFTSGERICQLHSSDFHPPFTSTEIENGSQINGTNESSRTQIEHNYAHGDTPDTQKGNKSGEKRPCNAEHVSEVPPRASSCSPTESQFLPAESQLEEDFSPVESSRNSDPFIVPESQRDSEFLPDESRLRPESFNQSTDIFDKDTQNDDSPPEEVPSVKSKKSKTFIRSFVPIRLPLSFLPEVPEAARFEELECDQEASSSPTGAKPTTSNERVGGVRTKEQLKELEQFRIQSSDSDDTDFEPDLSRRGVSRTQRSTSSPKQKSDGKDEGSKQPSAIVDLTVDEDEVIEASSGEENSGRFRRIRLDKLQKQNQPSTSRAERSTANEGRNTTVSSTRSGGSISDDDSDSSFDEAEAPGLAAAETAAKRSTNGTRKAEAPKKIKRLPPPTRNIVPWEQRQMVKYLIDNDYIPEAKGLKVWKQMIEDGFLKHRTAQSLNNHFRKVLLPTIHRFTMDRRCLKKFQRLQT